MAFLTIAGVTIPCAADGVQKKAPERIGSSLRAYAGGLRSTVRVEKRGWSVRTVPVSYATAQSIENAITLAAQVVCAGDFNNGSSVTCEVELTDTQYINASSGSDALGYMKVLTLTLREV